MKKEIKYIIMFRLTVIVFLVFITYATLVIIFFGSIERSNIINYGLDGSYKNQIVLETALTEMFRFSESISSDDDIHKFLSVDESESPAQRTKEIYDLMSTLKERLIYSDYIHSFCIVSNNNEAYWNIYPYDTYYYEFISDYIPAQQNQNEYSGFTKPFYFPDTGLMYQPVNLIGYVTNINYIEGRTVKTLGQIIVNLDLSVLSNDLATDDSIFSQIGILSYENEIIYLSAGDVQEFSELSLNLKESFNTTQNGYFFVNNIDSSGWKLVSRWQENQSSYQSESTLLWILAGVVVVVMVLIFSFVFPVLLNISKQITVLQNAIQKVSDGNLDVEISLQGSTELTGISNGFNQMVANTKQYMHNSLKNLEEKQKVSFELLLARINPHFIYNTLNSIVYLAKRNKTNEIIDLTVSFIALLQDSVQFDNNSLFDTVEVETKVVERYITIQKIRYASQFVYSSDVPTRLTGLLIPKNILQPLIENAIIHGACTTEDTKKVILDIKAFEDNLIIKISDTGIGMSQEKIDKILNTTHHHKVSGSSKMRPIGISNIMDKLQHIYGDNHSFTINSTLGKFTQVTITIPINK